jgi:hypothetical protein
LWHFGYIILLIKSRCLHVHLIPVFMHEPAWRCASTVRGYRWGTSELLKRKWSLKEATSAEKYYCVISAHSQVAQGNLPDHYLSSFLERCLAHFKRKTLSNEVTSPREVTSFVIDKTVASCHTLQSSNTLASPNLT